MTALCGGGPSGPKPGIAQQILYSAGGAEALALFSGAEWFSPWAALLGQIAYNTVESCATDPPGYPALTPDDFAASINYLDPVAMFSAIAKIRAWVQTFLWYTNCQCTGGGTPTNSPPAQPAGMPTSVGPVGSACYQTPQKLTALPPSNTAFIAANINCVPAADIATCLVSNPTSYYWTFAVSNTVPTGPAVTFHGQVRNAGVFRNSATKVLNPGQGGSLTLPYQAGDDLIQLVASVAAGTGTNTMTGQQMIFCNGVAPNTNAGPCCPPDPALMSMLAQIFATVTQLQRYEVPFAYVTGASHAGLTGTGTIVVPNGLIGLRLEITSVSPQTSEYAAAPDILAGAGWWSVETVDAVVDERRIRHLDQVWFPSFMSSVTRVGYSLPPGAVATIVELEAEP